MKLIRNAACCLCLIWSFNAANAQLYKITLDQKIGNSSLIVEGQVIDQRSFWNQQQTIIYTSNTVQVFKLFKGNVISKQVEVITQGGNVGGKALVVSDVLQLRKGDVGMFFCQQHQNNLRSPFTNNILYDVFSSDQGFLRYNLENHYAYAPFAEYDDIESILYRMVKQKTGLAENIIDTSFHIMHTGVTSNGVGGTLATITSFAPATVHAGALNDPANNILTINGSGFGSSPSGSAGINFKDANNAHVTPDYKILFNSPYIISWTDNKIVVNVPDRAGTGLFAVVLSNGTSVNSPSDLQVFFSVLDAQFTVAVDVNKVGEPRLMNTNGSGGYTYQYSNSTKGGGVDFTTSPAKQTFERAVATWKEIVGANLTQGAATDLQSVADDNVNLVLFDNNNTGVDKMAAGVLETTYSWFSACQSGQTLLTPQKTGFDILIRNNGVSLGGDVSFEEGPCFPNVGSYDLEMIILHEVGHALNLSHINDDYEGGVGGNYNTVNPSKLMHYAILDFVDRRSPDASAYQGALYTTTPQGNTYGSCGLFSSEMSPLSQNVPPTDECPSSFPASPIADNTTVIFDLTHATSNKFTDPAFTQVNCQNTGTSVTNNAYYAFMSGTRTDLTLTVSDYTTTPPALSSCNGQGVRLAVYDVSSCPEGQNYPQPGACLSFNSDRDITITGLQQNHKYLLYFDGIRNTKASFSVKFNSDSSSETPKTIVTVYPNPVPNGTLTVKLENAAGAEYEYALFDMIGKLVTQGRVSVSQSTQTFTIFMDSYASGVYLLKLVDENGKEVSTTKILK